MSIVRRAFTPRAERREAQIDLTGRGIAASQVLAPATADKAMRHSAYWASVNRIAEPISTMPIHRYRDVDGVAKQQSGTTVIEDPGTVMHRSGWIRQVLVSWLTEGNVFALPTEYTPDMRARRTVILDPKDMRCKLSPDGLGALRWYWKGQEVPNVIHWPAYTVPGMPIGLSPLAMAARSVGLGLSAEEFGYRWFLDGTHPSALLRTERVLTPEESAIAKERWVAAVANSRQPVVLGGGWTYDPISTPANESQFLETIQANVGDVARFFGLKPQHIGGKALDGMTYSNVEQEQLDVLAYPVLPWVLHLEDFLTYLTPRPQYVKVNPDVHVKADLETRYKVHKMALESGMNNPDERRALEDEPPIPDGSGKKFNWPPKPAQPAPMGGNP